MHFKKYIFQIQCQYLFIYLFTWKVCKYLCIAALSNHALLIHNLDSRIWRDIIVLYSKA